MKVKRPNRIHAATAKKCRRLTKPQCKLLAALAAGKATHPHPRTVATLINRGLMTEEYGDGRYTYRALTPAGRAALADKETDR